MVDAAAQTENIRTPQVELRNTEAVFRGKYLDEITSEMVEDFKSARKRERIQWAKNRSVTGATVNRTLTTLKLLFHQAQRCGYAVKSPVVGVAMYREPLDSMRVINFKEQAAYLAETSQPLQDIAKIILDTGMRPEEVFRMRAENLDFKQKSILNPYGKTKAARRSIPMTDDILRRATMTRNPLEVSRKHIVQPLSDPR